MLAGTVHSLPAAVAAVGVAKAGPESNKVPKTGNAGRPLVLTGLMLLLGQGEGRMIRCARSSRSQLFFVVHPVGAKAVRATPEQSGVRCAWCPWGHF